MNTIAHDLQVPALPDHCGRRFRLFQICSSDWTSLSEQVLTILCFIDTESLYRRDGCSLFCEVQWATANSKLLLLSPTRLLSNHQLSLKGRYARSLG